MANTQQTDRAPSGADAAKICQLSLKKVDGRGDCGERSGEAEGRGECEARESCGGESPGGCDGAASGHDAASHTLPLGEQHRYNRPSTENSPLLVVWGPRYSSGIMVPSGRSWWQLTCMGKQWSAEPGRSSVSIVQVRKTDAIAILGAGFICRSSMAVLNAKKKSCSRTWYFQKSPRTVHVFTPVFPIVQP